MSTARIAHGTNPQLLVEKILRERVYDCRFWKEQCFGINAATLLDRAYELRSIGGAYANQQPTEFLCLLLKLLGIHPERAIIYEYIRQPDFKYIRALGAMYLRLVGEPQEIYTHLEPLLEDGRKLRYRRPQDGQYELTFMDAFVDSLLVGDRVCDTTLPRLPKRDVLEDAGQLQARISPLQYLLEKEDDDASSSAASATPADDHQLRGNASSQPETAEPRLPLEVAADSEASPPRKKGLRLKLKGDNSTNSSSNAGVAKRNPSTTTAGLPIGSDRSQDAPTIATTSFRDEMSVEETNRVRISLGLKPLRE